MKTKMTAIFAVLLVALAVVGFAYAHWSEMLFIEGTVNTGSLDAVMSVGTCWDTETALKDYSRIECSLKVNDPKTLIVTIYNAYPCIDYYCKFDVTNTGTIPLHVIGFTPVDNLPAGRILEITELLGKQIHPGLSEYGTIHVHLPQEALETHTYTFTVTIEVSQWNLP